MSESELPPADRWATAAEVAEVAARLAERWAGTLQILAEHERSEREAAKRSERSD